MKLVIERGELMRALGHVTSVVERRTTIPILSNVLLKASGNALQFKATDLEREVQEQAPADVSQPGAVTVPAHILHDIVRKLPDGAEVEIKRDVEKERLTHHLGTIALRPANSAAGGFPRSGRRRAEPQVRHRRQRPEAPDRQDALCHLHRGDALLPQRHLSARGHARQGSHLAGRCHRRSSPGAGGAAAAGRCRRHARHHPAAQDRARAAPPDRGQPGDRLGRRVDRQGALRDRHHHADLQADRRHLPGLRPRDPQGQRQGAEGLQRRLQERRRSRLDHRQRARPRRQAQHQPQQADPVGQQSGRRQRHRGDRRRIRGGARSRSASTRAICSTSPASSRATRRSSSWPIRARRPWSGTAATKARSTCSCRCASEQRIAASEMANVRHVERRRAEP